MEVDGEEIITTLRSYEVIELINKFLVDNQLQPNLVSAIFNGICTYCFPIPLQTGLRADCLIFNDEQVHKFIREMVLDKETHQLRFPPMEEIAELH